MSSDLNRISNKAIQPIYASTFEASCDLAMKGKIVSLNGQPIKMSSDLKPVVH